MAKKKTEKKELVRLEVRTINNGYALTVEDEEYLFYSIDKLILGIAHRSKCSKDTGTQAKMYVEALEEGVSPVEHWTNKYTNEYNLRAKANERLDKYIMENISLRAKVERLENEITRLESNNNN